MKKLLILSLFLSIFFSACKKDKNAASQPISASSLATGKAGLRFTTDKNFKGSRSFELINTDLSISLSQFLGEAKNIRLDFIELEKSRSAVIDIMLNKDANTNSGSIQIDLAVPFFTAPTAPRALVRLEELAAFGSYFNTTYNSHSGNLTITKLTNTEIEGRFNTTGASSSGSSLVVSSGFFAGKF